MLIIIAVILVVLLFLLFAPIVFEIDSIKGLCQFRLRGFSSVTILFRDDRVLMSVWVLGWQKAFNPFAMRKESEHPRKIVVKKKSHRKPFHFHFRKWARFGGAMLKTFHTDLLYLSVDTGHPVLNSILFPAAFWVTMNQRVFRINYRRRSIEAARIEHAGTNLR